MAILELKKISKHFGAQMAVEKVDLSLNQNQVLCLLGPSGCGKTTLLRIIAGLETPEAGRVLFNGRDMAAVPPHKRGFRMMFQDFALFPHKSVYENVAFGLEMQNLSPKQIATRTQQMLALVGLKEFGERRVTQLSGGESQRVALARSLAPDPGLLLLDEPLGALDLALRKRLLLDIKRILAEIGVPTIFVTHDQSEAFVVAHRIAIMDKGRILQTAAPEQLYRQPACARVAAFLGFRNLVPGKVSKEGVFACELGTFAPHGGDRFPKKNAVLLLRPEAARLLDRDEVVSASSADSKAAPTIKGRVREWFFQGSHYHLRLETDSGRTLVFELPNHTPPPNSERLAVLTIDPAGIVVLDP
jgi:ABC-type Fe3+/spermidine/putrescine transport system ATPase subunit